MSPRGHLPIQRKKPLRDYQRDDEYRTIDWKATARRQKWITRDNEQERNQSVLCMLDCGCRASNRVIAASYDIHAQIVETDFEAEALEIDDELASRDPVLAQLAAAAVSGLPVPSGPDLKPRPAQRGEVAERSEAGEGLTVSHPKDPGRMTRILQG